MNERRTGRCAACDFDWDDEGTARLIAIVRDAPQHFATATSRERPAPAVWSPLEYAVHTTSALDFYADRIERVLIHDEPQLAAFDFNAACENERYNERDADDALAALARAAQRLAAVLAPLTPEQWQRRGVGSDGDERTVNLLARRAAHEVQHHALDVR